MRNETITSNNILRSITSNNILQILFLFTYIFVCGLAENTLFRHTII